MSSAFDVLSLVGQAAGETLLMVMLSLAFSCAIGLVLAVILVLTSPTGLSPNKPVYLGLGWLVNTGRSIPFVILMVAIIPFTRLVAGTSIGPWASVVPLTVAASPFVARVFEAAMNSVDKGVVDACVAMGASVLQVVRYVYLPESTASLVSGAAITAVNLIGYSAMAGAIGGGGLGDLAIRYGYQRWRPDVMLASVAVLLAMVQAIQFVGDRISRSIRTR